MDKGYTHSIANTAANGYSKMKKIWTEIDSLLSQFHTCFSRDAAINWFIIVIIRLIVHEDHFGVTSIIPALCIDQLLYGHLMHFFRSITWSVGTIAGKWASIVAASDVIHLVDGKLLLVIDGVKVSKEAGGWSVLRSNIRSQAIQRSRSI